MAISYSTRTTLHLLCLMFLHTANSLQLIVLAAAGMSSVLFLRVVVLVMDQGLFYC